jgi:ketosteroid isomerase-like protein
VATDDLQDLARRLAAIEEERAVLRRLHAYAHAIDYGDEAGWVDCFCEDGVFDIRGRGGTDGYTRKVSGRAALAEFVSFHSRAPEAYHKHCIVEPQITVDGDTAHAESYLFVMVDVETEPVVRVFGRYVDTLRKEPDGKWRFELRIAEVESVIRDLPPLAYARLPPGERPILS